MPVRSNKSMQRTKIFIQIEMLVSEFLFTLRRSDRILYARARSWYCVANLAVLRRILLHCGVYLISLTDCC